MEKKKENNQRIAEPVFSVMRFLGKERIHKFKVKRFLKHKLIRVFEHWIGKISKYFSIFPFLWNYVLKSHVSLVVFILIIFLVFPGMICV